MRIVCVFVAVIVLTGVWDCRAQVTGYPIKLSGGVIKQDQSGRTVSVSFNKKWLVGNANLLVLVIDTDNQQLRLQNVDPQTNLVATLGESTRCSFLPDGTFDGILEYSALTVTNGLFSTTGDGAMLIHGQVNITSLSGNTKVSGKLQGVLNDPANGNPDAPNESIKATIQPAGKGFDAEPFGL